MAKADNMIAKLTADDTWSVRIYPGASRAVVKAQVRNHEFITAAEYVVKLSKALTPDVEESAKILSKVAVNVFEKFKAENKAIFATKRKRR